MTSRKSQNTVQDSSNPSVHIDLEMVDEDLQDCDVLQEIEEEEELREEAEAQTTQRAKARAKKTTRTKKASAPAQGQKRKESDGTRSKHWLDYTIEYVEEGDPPIIRKKGRCKRCGVLIGADPYNQGTSGLKNHTAMHVKKDEAAKAAQNSQTVLNFTASVGGSSSLTTWRFDQKAIRLALCEMIIIDELPFRFVEREGFRRFMERVCPQFQIPSRITIRADCVKLFLENKSFLKSFFQKKGFGRVSLTTDCWTAVNNTNFICVTAHCISKDWKLHKKIISFKKIVSHKANDVGEAIVESLIEWGLQNILCCTVDNASANDGALRCVKSYLATSNTDIMGGKYLHMRCAAHILNLIVQDGLDEIGLSVRRVREAVKWVKASPARLAQFQEHVNYIHLDCKKMLSLDVPTRWNSTYLMLESAEPYEEVFKWLKLKKHYVDDLNQKKYNNSIIGPPDDDDWINVRKMIEYLKKFYEVTLLVSGSQYASSHLFFVELCDIFDLITDLEENDDIEVSSMAGKMKAKIGKYWLEEEELNSKMNRLLYIAAVLDPRQKMKHVERCFRSLYESQRATAMIGEVIDSLNDLLEFYKSNHDGASSQSRSIGTSRVFPTHGRSDRRGSLSLVALQANAAAGPDESYSELTEYLAEKQHWVAPENCDQFDILNWWQTTSVRFPVLSEIARDVLAVPISSVASEAAFSTGGRVLSAFRSSLSHSMVEALICSEDWLKTSFVEKKDEEDIPDEELEQEFAAGNNHLLL